MSEQSGESEASPDGFVPVPRDRVRAGLGAWGLHDAELAVLPRGASGEVFEVESRGGRLVAKFAYMDRRDFEPGLLAAEVISQSGLRAAAPRRTREGALVVMVEWPDGAEHPLAVLEHVAGSPVDPTTTAGAAIVGTVLGQVHRVLINLPSERLALEPPRDYLRYLRTTHQPLGPHGWLHDYNLDLVAQIDALTSTAPLTVGPGVWDGPEIVVDQHGVIGLIDFGNVDVHPTAHVLAYGTTQVSRPGRTDPQNESIFLDAFTRVCPVTDGDIAAVGLFRKLTLAIYAKFMAARRAARRLPPELDDALDRTLAELQ